MGSSSGNNGDVGSGSAGMDGGHDKGSYFKHEKMKEIFAKLGIEDWQSLYTLDDIEQCFDLYVKLLNYNE